MCKIEELLIDSLNTRSPILFLGAGFSCDAQCNDIPLPTSEDLKKIIFDHFYINNPPAQLTKDDLKNVQDYSLDRLCQTITDEGRGTMLRETLISIFKGTRPSPTNPYHNLLCDYYWQKIYTLNIDDLVENIYADNGIKFVVQNDAIRKDTNNIREIIKLHGCVNNPDNGFVFNCDEYAGNIAHADHRIKEFCADFFKNDIIFLGTNFNESDIRVILEKTMNAGYVNDTHNYFFITPKADYGLKRFIEKRSNFYLIEWNTEKFLNECSKLKKSEQDLIGCENLLKQYGFQKVQDCATVNPAYESHLYYGNRAIFADIFANWDIVNTKTAKVKNRIERESVNCCYVLTICGKSFIGKSVVAKRLLVELYKDGYSAYSYDCAGEDELKLFMNYVNKATHLSKVAVLIEDAAYLYEYIAKAVTQLPKHIKSFIFILISETKKHTSKKHELYDLPCVLEWEVNDELNDINSTIVYNKLKEKNRLGKLNRLEKHNAIIQIKESKYLVEFLFNLTQGMGFKSYFKKELDDLKFKASRDTLTYFKCLCVLSKMGIHNISEYLLMLNCPSIDTSALENVAVGFGSSSGVMLRCSNAYDAFLYSISEEERCDIVYNILNSIANLFNESSNNRWKDIFEQLLKKDSLYRSLKISAKNIISLFAKLEKKFCNISYFWLQRGLAKQLVHEFDDSSIFLDQALKIRPASYQIRHAIARNKLDQAIYQLKNKCSYDDAWKLFDDGLFDMLGLINSAKFSRSLRYSVHTYIHFTLQFYNTADKKIPEEDLTDMSELLSKGSEQSFDGWMENCRKELYEYCRKNATNFVHLFEAKRFNKYKHNDTIIRI